MAAACPETDGPNGPRKERETHAPRYARVADRHPPAARPTGRRDTKGRDPLPCIASTRQRVPVVSETLHIGPPVTIWTALGLVETAAL